MSCKTLLTPQKVAELLSLSVRTIYDNHRKLGGFYPAGIKRLRFREDVIHGIMEGQNSQGLVLQVPVPKETIRKPGLHYKESSYSGAGTAQKTCFDQFETSPELHGL